MKITIWIGDRPVVLEDVPVDGPCCTWTDQEIRKYMPVEDLRDEIDRAINQELSA